MDSSSSINRSRKTTLNLTTRGSLSRNNNRGRRRQRCYSKPLIDNNNYYGLRQMIVELPPQISENPMISENPLVDQFFNGSPFQDPMVDQLFNSSPFQ